VLDAIVDYLVTRNANLGGVFIPAGWQTARHTL
jgi:hypothetical protein